MFIDTAKLDSSYEVDTEVCIIGGGAAGIILALELAHAGIGCCIVESGGHELEPETQSLYEGAVVPASYHSLDASRLRYFGGSTNHWTGWTRPLDAQDFARRDWIPDSGWPISRNDLDPYYALAQEYFQLGKHPWEAGYWERQIGRTLLPAGEQIESGIVRHSPPTRFGPLYGPRLEEDPEVQVFLHANLTNIHLLPNKRAVGHVSARSLSGKRLRVRARQFVLAAGGIENARILLNCTDDHKKGLGNQHDLVGRYFADHRGAQLGQVVFAAFPERVESYDTFFRRDPEENFTITSGVKLTAETQQRLKLPNFGVVFTHKRLVPAHALPMPLARQGYVPVVAALASVEPLPNPESRVTLTAERDPLGMRRVALDFRLGNDYVEQLHRCGMAFATAWTRAGFGPAQPDRDFAMPPGRPGYGDHHMGTTRMAESPRKGVVDRDCRIHGMDNLYVAGSSVFPTFGYAQPTFTIGALAIRLARHLAGRNA